MADVDMEMEPDCFSAEISDDVTHTHLHMASQGEGVNIRMQYESLEKVFSAILCHMFNTSKTPDDVFSKRIIQLLEKMTENKLLERQVLQLLKHADQMESEGADGVTEGQLSLLGGDRNP